MAVKAVAIAVNGLKHWMSYGVKFMVIYNNVYVEAKRKQFHTVLIILLQR